MAYRMSRGAVDALFATLRQDAVLFAPKCFPDGAAFSDADLVRYGPIESVGEIAFDRKSAQSFKEALLPISQTLFYFTENYVKESDPPAKHAIVFLRSCDLHAVKRLDEVYLRIAFPDSYYARIRDNAKFILIGCPQSFDNCFCASMGTNRCDSYDAAIELCDDGYRFDCKDPAWEALLGELETERVDYIPSFAAENAVRVSIPADLTPALNASPIWDEYDARCINCGRCNFSCPTCTCNTMQDMFYEENGRVGERRRVWASCMVDGFTNVAGGGCYRPKNGQRMRYKVMHKVRDFTKRNGYHMCVGCGRCDDVCPEYISFSACLNKLSAAAEEVNRHDAK